MMIFCDEVDRARGQTRGKFGAAKSLDEPFDGHVDRAVEPNVIGGLRDPRGRYPGGRSITQ
jgi:hypothetical protein